MADFTRGRRMPKHWHAITGVEISMTSSAVFAGGSLALDGPWTAIRMLGEYIIGLDAAPTAQDACQIGVGIGVVSSDAAALGATALPDPITEPEYPWLYWTNHRFFFTSTDLLANVMGAVRVPFDIRSMRKLKPRESLAVVVEYSDIAGAPAMQFSMSTTRVLVAT